MYSNKKCCLINTEILSLILHPAHLNASDWPSEMCSVDMSVIGYNAQPCKNML